MTLQARYDQALAAHRRGAFAQAEQLYRALLGDAPSSFAAHHMLGVLRAQMGDTQEGLELIAAALALKPDAADAWFNYANMLKGNGRLEEALAACERALAVRSDYPAAEALRAQLRGLAAEALNRSGNDHRAAGRFEIALCDYEKALMLAPGYGDALNNRAVTLLSMGQLEQALAGFDAALAARPDYVEAHYNRGNTLRDLQRLDEAMQSFDRATAIDLEFAPAYSNKAFCALLKGDFATGLLLYEWRKRLKPPIEARSYAQPLWTGAEDIRGKTVFLYAEQGLGDAIQFYRFVTPLLARGAEVTLSVQDGLLRLLENASPKVTLVGARAVPARFDYHIPLMSLPLALGLTAQTIPNTAPYLKAEPERVARWARRIGEKGFKIGVSWQGAPGGVTSRAMPLTCFEGLSRLAGVRLISLQKGLGAEQLAALPAVESLGEDFDAGPDAFLDSAAAMQSLDLVITLDSALAHLAGALGRPVWVALKQVPDWRWFLGRSDSPWYSDMKLFRQTANGDWSGVFGEMESRVAR